MLFNLKKKKQGDESINIYHAALVHPTKAEVAWFIFAVRDGASMSLTKVPGRQFLIIIKPLTMGLIMQSQPQCH